MKKSTENLWDEMLVTDNADTFFENNPDDIVFNGIEEMFSHFLAQKKLKKGEVFNAANISERFGRMIISGERGATRDKVIQLCFGLRLNLAEAQRFIKISGNRELYVRDPRDAVIIFSIKDGKNLIDTNLELEKKRLTILG